VLDLGPVVPELKKKTTAQVRCRGYSLVVSHFAATQQSGWRDNCPQRNGGIMAHDKLRELLKEFETLAANEEIVLTGRSMCDPERQNRTVYLLNLRRWAETIRELLK
jgi:hypothetical protein